MPYDLTGSAASEREAQRIRRLWLIPPLMLVVAVIASVLAWPHLPDEMPTHWGVTGRPTNLTPRGFAVAILPALMLWIGFLTSALMWSASRARYGHDLPAWLSPVVTTAVLGVMLLLHLALLGVGLGWGIRIPLVTNLVVGALFLAMGRLTRDAPANPVFGIRTPATLASPDAWRAANRVAGRWMMGAGAITVAAAPLPGGWPLGVMLGSVLVACTAAVQAGKRAAAGEG